MRCNVASIRGIVQCLLVVAAFKFLLSMQIRYVPFFITCDQNAESEVSMTLSARALSRNTLSAISFSIESLRAGCQFFRTSSHCFRSTSNFMGSSFAANLLVAVANRWRIWGRSRNLLIFCWSDGGPATWMRSLTDTDVGEGWYVGSGPTESGMPLSSSHSSLRNARLGSRGGGRSSEIPFVVEVPERCLSLNELKLGAAHSPLDWSIEEELADSIIVLVPPAILSSGER